MKTYWGRNVDLRTVGLLTKYQLFRRYVAASHTDIARLPITVFALELLQNKCVDNKTSLSKALPASGKLSAVKIYFQYLLFLFYRDLIQALWKIICLPRDYPISVDACKPSCKCNCFDWIWLITLIYCTGCDGTITLCYRGEKQTNRALVDFTRFTADVCGN